jgi:hypothetical protein
MNVVVVVTVVFSVCVCVCDLSRVKTKESERARARTKRRAIINIISPLYTPLNHPQSSLYPILFVLMLRQWCGTDVTSDRARQQTTNNERMRQRLSHTQTHGNRNFK